MPNKHLDRSDPLYGKKSGKWTKYGGSIGGLVKEAIQDVWYCQTCGREMPKEISPFLFEVFTDDFLRICGICQNTASKRKIVEVHRIIKIERIYRE
jgi:hypothetical protein